MMTNREKIYKEFWDNQQIYTSPWRFVCGVNQETIRVAIDIHKDETTITIEKDIGVYWSWNPETKRFSLVKRRNIGLVNTKQSRTDKFFRN